VVDIMGGMFGAFGTVLALKQRDRTAGAAWSTSALFESVVFLMGQHLAITAMNGAPPPPMPERVSSWAVYEILQHRRRHQMFIGITSDGQWKRFCEVFKQAELAADPRLASNNQRIEARPWLIPKVAEVFKRYGKDALEQLCLEADVSSPRWRGRRICSTSAPVGQRLAGADNLAGRRQDTPAAAAVPDIRLASAAHARSARNRPAQ